MELAFVSQASPLTTINPNAISLRGAQLQPAETNSKHLSVGMTAAVIGAVASSRHRCNHISMKARGGAFDASTEIGVTAPLGFFDPLSCLKGKDEAHFKKMRSAEIKHGRVAMMASIGFLAQHYFKLPSFSQVPDGMNAIFDTKGEIGLAALFFFSGSLELFFWKERAGQPGDLGDPMGLINGAIFGGYDSEWRNKELNNGRMAMFAVLGIVAAEIVTGKDAIQQFS